MSDCRGNAGPGHGDGNFLNVSERNANYFLEEPLKNGGVVVGRRSVVTA